MKKIQSMILMLLVVVMGMTVQSCSKEETKIIDGGIVTYSRQAYNNTLKFKDRAVGDYLDHTVYAQLSQSEGADLNNFIALVNAADETLKASSDATDSFVLNLYEGALKSYKSGKGFANAEKMMVALLKDSANLNNMRIYDMWLQSVEKQYDQVNEQMYKKQVVDTASLFGLTQRIFMIAERLDSIDMRPDKKGRVHLTYREDNAQRLDTYRPNLFFGGTYFLRKNDLQRAYDFFERYIDCAQQPLFTDFRYEETDTRLPEAAYWATYCGYRMDNPVLALRYAKLAKRDTLKLESTLQYVSQAWLRLKDDASYIATLQEGFQLFPKSGYFFPRLMDSYTSKGNYTKALSVADEALAVDSLRHWLWIASIRCFCWQRARCSLMSGIMPNVSTIVIGLLRWTVRWLMPTIMPERLI